jgi:hypothetical protein
VNILIQAYHSVQPHGLIRIAAQVFFNAFPISGVMPALEEG